MVIAIIMLKEYGDKPAVITGLRAEQIDKEIADLKYIPLCSV